jgi:hypothetical protein
MGITDQNLFKGNRRAPTVDSDKGNAVTVRSDIFNLSIRVVIMETANHAIGLDIAK